MGIKDGFTLFGRKSNESISEDINTQSIAELSGISPQRDPELERKAKIDATRKGVHCDFNDGISEREFSVIARNAASQISKITNVGTFGSLIKCSVASESTLYDWDFYLDFNNWGHIDGTYWLTSGNNDSNIPGHFGDIVASEINSILVQNGISVPNYSIFVDSNKDLGTKKALYVNEVKRENKTFSNKRVTAISSAAKLHGEHIYAVISMLKYNGFKSIKCIPVKDVTPTSKHYVLQTEQVLINRAAFNVGDTFSENDEILITYHDIKEIKLPYDSKHYRKKHYREVSRELHKLGFTEIYEQPVRDLITGWLVKDGTVANIRINKKTQFPKGARVKYNTRIVVEYHTFR